jgi:outer membrane lipoprotein-sorting protein
MCAQQPDEKPDNPLERAIACLRDRADAALKASPKPTPQAIRQTIERLATAQEFSSPPFFTWRSIMLNPIFRFSIAASIIIALAGVLWFSGPGSGTIAFADVIANVSAVRSVSYKMSGSVNVPGRGPIPIQSDVLIAEPARMRQVTQPGGMIMIWDFAAGKMTTLEPNTKTATVLDITNQPKQANTTNILEQFKNLNSRDYDPVPGERTIENHLVVGFKPKATAATAQLWQMVWVDKQTRLPVQIDAAMRIGAMPDANMVMNNFKWNVPVDEASLETTPPAGYQSQSATMSAAPATEKEFLDGLRTLAELNHNAFPDRLDFTAAVDIVAKHEMPVKPTSKPADLKALQAKLLPLMTKVTRSVMFPAYPTSGSDFRYAGKGVALNQADTPILWYRPNGAQTYRVINADLTVHDVNPDERPKVKSVPLGRPMGGPSTQPDSSATLPSPAERPMP